MADCKKYGRTANLFDLSTLTKYGGASAFSIDGNKVTMVGSNSAGNYYYPNIVYDAGTYMFTFSANNNNTYFVMASNSDLNNAKINNASLSANQPNIVANLGYGYARYISPRSQNLTIYSDVSFIICFAPTITDYIVEDIELTTNAWQHSLRKLTTVTDTITTLPAVIYADGTNATVGLKGNMSQSETPSPTTPIQPSETGERTGNLFDISKVTSTTEITNNGDGTLTVSGYPSNTSVNLGVLCPDLKDGDIATLKFNTTSTANLVLIRYYDSSGLKWSEDWYSGTSKTITAEWLNARIGFYKEAGAQGGGDATISNIMLNTGSTALLYEPYGVKIPISSASTTTPVYLGEVQTTRKVKKLVLTGNEEYIYDPSYSRFIAVFPNAKIEGLRLTQVYCTHFTSVYDGRSISEVPNNSIYSSDVATNRFFIKTTNYTTAADFESYLAQQYANGTPVTVWYVLQTATTGIINEPLRKIGNYADTVSGISIPTITGKDTVDVETTLKPSEVELTYTGWHDATVKEWDGSDWNE